jgi:hypothetical protein
MVTFLNLPNQVPAPNSNNLTAEATKYTELYESLNRTNTGSETFTSSSSGVKYSTGDYPDDTDVYNKGQVGMMNLLYKYVLSKYIIQSSTVNEIVDRSNNTVIDVDTISFNEQSLIYNIALKYEPTTSIYSIRFRAPNNYVVGSVMNISYTTSSGETVIDTVTPVLSGSTDKMPANTFVKDRTITANVDKTNNIITFNASATDVLVRSESAPTSDSDKTKIWLNTSNGTLNYWNGTDWTGCVGVWG